MLPGIAIFGNGPLVKLLVRYFRANGFHIEAIWSPTGEQTQELAVELQITNYSSVIDKILLLPSVQLIVIAAAPHFHSQIASKACGIGKHVICNWPPAYSLAEMATMQSAASNYPSLITLIVTALRFIPAFQLMRKLIVEDRLIGQVKAISGLVLCDVFSIFEEKSIIWDRFMGGGLLSAFGTNLIDIITFTTGLRARKVNAIIRTYNDLTKNPIIRNNADDFVTFQMEMYPSESENSVTQESVIATITLNGLHYCQLPGHELVVYGANGYLAYRNGNLYGKLKHISNAPSEQATQNGSISSGHDSMNSLSKENIFYLDDNEVTAGGEFSNGGHSLGSASSLSSAKSHIWPEIYQRGISNLVAALRKAFFGEADQNYPLNGPMDESTTVHSMVCPQVVQSPSSGSLKEEMLDEIRWIKEPVSLAANFDEGFYIQSVIEAIKQSSELQQWVRVSVETP